MTVPLSQERLEEIRAKYIAKAHYGNGTGCRCCDLVDNGYLEELLVELDRLTLELRWATQRITRLKGPPNG